MSILRPVPDPDTDTKVLLACDHALQRAGYRAVLEADPHVCVIGEAVSGRDAVALARGLRPDVIVMDVDISDAACVPTTAELCADPGAPVLLLTGAEDDSRAFDALRAGAAGVLVKDAPPDALTRAVEVSTRGEVVLSPGLTRRLIGELVSRPEPSRAADESMAALTEREREVVALVALGLTNDEIADQLVVTPATARTHVSRATVKLQARDRAQLVVFAYEGGLVLQPGL